MAEDSVERPRKRQRVSWKDTIQVFVVKSREKFIVHRSVIEAKSNLAKQYAGKPKLTLHYITMEVFESYLHWLYTSEIDTTGLQNIDEAQGTAEPTWFALARLWEVATFMHDSQLCNEIVDLMLDKFEPTLGVSEDRQIPEIEKEEGFAKTLEYLLVESSCTGENVYRLFTDMLFTAMRNDEEKASVIMEQMAANVLFVFAYRWTKGISGKEIPLDKEARKECRERYYQQQYPPRAV